MLPIDQLSLEILNIEHPGTAAVLKISSAPVSFPLINEDIVLIQAMKNKLHQLGGVGLAAPQVGYNKRIIVIYIPENAVLLRDNATPYPLHVLINPSYEIVTANQISDFESCYSVATKSGKVPRYQSIALTYQNEQGQFISAVESDFYARVLQHEIDHLNGILITDRLTSDCLQGTIESMMAIRRSELCAEKRALFDKLMEKKFKPKPN